MDAPPAIGFSGNDLRAARVARGRSAADLAPYLNMTAFGVRRLERLSEVGPDDVARYFEAVASAVACSRAAAR